jgi:adenosylcobinamide-GDP ribazoletransferase
MPALRALLAAVAFLTRVPVPVRLGREDVARGAPFFPLVGAGIGAAAAGIALLAHPRLSPVLAAALAAAATMLLTGALHLDGLADTFDALGGSGRERALEIMRDSRIGSFGATALVLALVIRIGALAQLVGGGPVLRASIAAGALSRGTAAALAALLPYARSEGAVLAGRQAVFAVPVALAVAAVAEPSAIAVAVVPAVLLALLFRRAFGGVTGDTLGAASELTELAVLVSAAALA